MDASNVGDAEAGDHTGGSAQTEGKCSAFLADRFGKGLVGGDHRDGVEATGQEQKFWVGRVGATQGSSDIGSNVADGGSSGARGRENRAEVPLDGLENKNITHVPEGWWQKPSSSETAGHPRAQGVPIIF